MRWMSLALVLGACGDKEVVDDSTDDSGVEADADADADSDTDTDADSDVELWSWCPDADSYVGQGQGQVVVGERALYCTAPDESLSLPQTLDRKRQVRMVPGSYAVPLEEGSVDFAFPACVRTPGDEQPVMDGAGSAAVTVYDFGELWHSINVQQPFTQGGRLDVSLNLVGDPPDTYTLDGGGNNEPDNGYSVGFSGVYFGPCVEDSWTQETHSADFEGGSLSLRLQVQRETGGITAGTEPSAYPWARGQFGGQDFEQRDPFKLIYVPEHHHFARHFAVLFDAEIDGVCGLRMDVADGTSGAGVSVSSVDCGLDTIEALTVTASDYSRE